MTAGPAPMTTARSATLVDLNWAARYRRTNPQRIELLVDGGLLFEPGLRWVWNLATDPQGRERFLRFLDLEIEGPELCQCLTLPKVLTLLLGERRQEFPTGAVCDLLLIRYKHLRALKASGQLPSNESTPRAAMEKFLTTRLIHPAAPTKGKTK